MKQLILVKHASPRIEPNRPPDTWELSPEGREKAQALVEHLRPYAPGAVVTSEEPKAAQTGRILAQGLGIEATTAPGLHEHDRSNVPHMRSANFISHMELFFRRPDECVLGMESARAALQRFETALRQVVEQQHGHDTMVVVGHGTVIALLIAANNLQHSGFALWRQMKLPSYAVLDVPGFAARRIIPSI